MNIVEIAGLKKSFITPSGERRLVVHVPQFQAAVGVAVAIAGESGVGKTTFLHLVAGILRPDEGRVAVAGEEIGAMPEAARDKFRAANVGYIFQTFNLLQGYTALENVLLAMSFGRGVDLSRARSLLDRVGLSDRLNHRPRHLSVGQQQRVAIARALANKPKLVLADEPTGNLDARNARECLRLIREVCAENGSALILVSHDPDVHADFSTVLPFGRINAAEDRPA